MKANSALAILKLLAERGAGFDIVSGGELERVLAAAPEAVGRVVFSGVGKTAAEIDLALKAGHSGVQRGERGGAGTAGRARPQAQEAGALCAARESRCFCRDASVHFNRTARAQVRHRYPPGAAPSTRARPATAGLRRYGVSVHIGSQIRSAEPFGAAMERVRKLVQQLRREGIELKVIDAGGGLGIDYHAGDF